MSNDTVPRSYYDLKITQLEQELSEYQAFFELLVKLLEKHGIDARTFHESL